MLELKNIWLATDFSDNSAAAVPYAVELARHFSGHVTLVHVFDGTYLSEAIGDGMVGIEAAHWIDPIYERLGTIVRERAASLAEREKIPVTPLLLRGNTVREIIKGLQQHKADCLVISTHGRTGLNHAVWGSIAERLVRISPCPVFSINPSHVPKK